MDYFFGRFSIVTYSVLGSVAAAALSLADKVFLIPGHCDPTCNLHDWYVVIDDEKVIDLWPVSARGYSF